MPIRTANKLGTVIDGRPLIDPVLWGKVHNRYFITW
jgi:hypothetical protein